MNIGQLRFIMVRIAPEGSPRRKLLQLIAIVLAVEGLSVFALFSYAWIGVGAVSVLIGVVLLLLLHLPEKRDVAPAIESPGIRFIEWSMAVLGGGFSFVVLGASIVALVLLYNFVASERPSIGDLDTISMFFGGLLVVYPRLARDFSTEAGFCLIFTGFVVVFLVLPQVVTSLSADSGSSPIGDWYVEYMLAAPFAGMLDLIGIPSSASGNMVTIEFKDGTVQLLSISAYCAGLYSFSIFLSAFFSFVLVFERLSRRTLAMVLSLGMIVAYLGNLFRMIIIGVVGYHYGLDALLWTHENIGWIIFLAWSAVFWWALLSWLSRRDSAVVSDV